MHGSYARYWEKSLIFLIRSNVEFIKTWSGLPLDIPSTVILLKLLNYLISTKLANITEANINSFTV